jgi:hypothetical protein
MPAFMKFMLSLTIGTSININMRKLTFTFITIPFLLAASYLSYGQGCSDAGFCSINSFKPNDADNRDAFDNQFKIGAFFGKADNSIAVYGNYLEYNRQLNSKFGFDARLTTLAQTGNDISVFGISDIFANAHYRASRQIKLTAGLKIPLSNAGKSYETLPLPMDYQASLGTFDLIFGIGYEINKIQLVAAIQQPLSQNDNRFLSGNYPVSSALRNFQSTNKFERSGDVLLRVSYPININSKLRFTPGILPIYHLKNDKYTDELNVKREIKGSQGLTLNGNIFLDYQLNSKSFIQMNLGMPFIVRDARPDGLARSFIMNLEYRFGF